MMFVGFRDGEFSATLPNGDPLPLGPVLTIEDIRIECTDLPCPVQPGRTLTIIHFRFYDAGAWFQGQLHTYSVLIPHAFASFIMDYGECDIVLDKHIAHGHAYYVPRLLSAPELRPF